MKIAWTNETTYCRNGGHIRVRETPTTYPTSTDNPADWPTGDEDQNEGTEGDLREYAHRAILLGRSETRTNGLYQIRVGQAILLFLE